MGLFDAIGLFGFGNKPKKAEPPKVEEKPAPVKKEKKLSPKEQATLNGEPYVNVIGMEVDPNDINSGAFELDYNDKFVLNLIKSGYRMKDTDTDQMIVDRWFQQVCRNIALELYEQQQADPTNRHRTEPRIVSRKDLGNGRSEIS